MAAASRPPADAQGCERRVFREAISDPQFRSSLARSHSVVWAQAPVLILGGPDPPVQLRICDFSLSTVSRSAASR
jgi:hypothetical protein